MTSRTSNLLFRSLLSIVLVAGGENCLPGTAQDFLDENPEFKRIYLQLSSEDREYLARHLSSLSPADRKRFMAYAVEMEQNQITVEHVYAKYFPASGKQQRLNVVPFPPDKQPLTENELRQLEGLKLRGQLEIVGFGSVGKGPKVRVILIMQKQVLSRAEFALPAEGSLILVQTANTWLLQPSEYKMSQKTLRIQESSTGKNRTSVDYDIGNGRAGSDAFGWPE